MRKLHFNEPAYKADLSNHQKVVDKINEFAEALKSEGLILTSELLAEFMNDPIACIQRIMVESTVNEFNKKGILVNSVMLKGFECDAESIAPKFREFQKVLQDEARNTQVNLLEIPIATGKAFLDADEKKRIADSHTIYIRPEDEKLFEKLSQIAESINEASAELSKEGGISLLTNLEIIATKNSYVVDANFKRAFRTDICFNRNDQGKIETNPGFFHGRHSKAKDRLS